MTRKALTHCPRRLERSGLLSRRIIAAAPIGVEYEITPLDRSLEIPFAALHAWMLPYLDQVQAARRAFDERAAA